MRQYLAAAKGFKIAMWPKERKLGRRLELLEFWKRPNVRGARRWTFFFELRVIVQENPFGTGSTDPRAFRGRYDERYAGSDGRIVWSMDLFGEENL